MKSISCSLYSGLSMVQRFHLPSIICVLNTLGTHEHRVREDNISVTGTKQQTGKLNHTTDRPGFHEDYRKPYLLKRYNIEGMVEF